MEDSTAEARQRVVEARRALATEMDDLGTASRGALDIPAKVRRNPVRTVGLAGGAAFLLLGGPKRGAKAVERRLFPRRAERPPSLLPKNVEKALKRVPGDEREQVQAHLERDFATYLEKEHTKEPATARQSLWKTYDLVIGIIGAAAARELVKKLVEIPQESRVEAIKDEGEAIAEAHEKIADAKK